MHSLSGTPGLFPLLPLLFVSLLSRAAPLRSATETCSSRETAIVREKPFMPKRGHRMKTSWLPRDIRAGWSPRDQPSTLLHGWDQTSDTFQLWRVVTSGDDGESEFVGYIHRTPPE